MAPKKKGSLFRQLILMLALCLLGLIGAYGLVTFQFNESSHNLQRELERHKATVVLSHSLSQMVAEERWLILQQSQYPKPNFSQALRDISLAYDSPQLAFLKLNISLDERKIVEDIRIMERQLMVKALHLTHFIQTGNKEKADRIFAEYQTLENNLRTGLDQLNSLQSQKLEHLAQAQIRSSHTWLISMLSLGLAGILVLVGVGFFLQIGFIRPLKGVMEAVNRIQQGDFSGAWATDSAGQHEMAELRTGIAYMAKSLSDLYGDLERQVNVRTEELNRAQSQLLQAEKMSAMGQMVSGVAHEVNNPLTVIMGCAELAKLKIQEHQLDGILPMLDDILDQAERCKHTVSGLLKFSRKSAPALTACDLNQLIQDVVRLRLYEMTTTQIHLNLDLDPTVPSLTLDGHRIQQVILNLINNAIDAIRGHAESGEIFITTRMEENTIKLTIQDTGGGIRHPDRVFEPFFTTKEPGKGTGLGLSLCEQIVREHGGLIRAKNVNKGARFEVSLPRHQPTPTEVQAKPIRPVPATVKGLNALVVDDETSILEIQSVFLKRLGISATLVESVEKAIEFVEKQKPDLIICDIHLKGQMDGFGFFHWLETHRPELVRHFIFISGDLVALRSTKMESTHCPYLQKPFTFQQFKQCILEEALA